MYVDPNHQLSYIVAILLEGRRRVSAKAAVSLCFAVTVLVIIKLTKFAVALRLRCGSCKLIF